MQTQQTAIRVLKDAKTKGVVAGKDPMVLPQALYVACVLESERRLRRIAEIANVTGHRPEYTRLEESLGLNA